MDHCLRFCDGQFVGQLTMEGAVFDCWLVFDDWGADVKDPSFLKLSFEDPYPQTKDVGGE
jgi:hypothetical protein